MDLARFRFEQRSGRILRPDGTVLALGYSGFSYGKDNPEAQDIPGIGPLPQGLYTMGEPYDHEGLGPFCMDLDPLEDTNTFGRSLFRWHGDARLHPGAASHGCIVSSRSSREDAWDSGVRIIECVSGDEPRGVA